MTLYLFTGLILLVTVLHVYEQAHYNQLYH